jgi:hypothetical protein
MSNNSRISHLISNFRRTWSELDYAERRLFEIQTGISATGYPQQPSIARKTSDLEALLDHTAADRS